jgi:hypothetical protein
MTDSSLDFGYTDGDVDTNHSTTTSLNELADARFSRRQTLRSGAMATTAAVFGSTMLAACDSDTRLPIDAPPVVTAGERRHHRRPLVTLTGTATDDGRVKGVCLGADRGPAVTLTSTATPRPSWRPTLPRRPRSPSASPPPTATTRPPAPPTVTVSPATLGFAAVAKNKLDVVTVPAGYTVQIGARLGDPIATGVAAFKNDGTDTNFAQRIGDHGDAMRWFGLSATGTRDETSSTRGLIVQNHENINQQSISTRPADFDRRRPPRGRGAQGDRVPRRQRRRICRRRRRAWAYVQGSPSTAASPRARRWCSTARSRAIRCSRRPSRRPVPPAAARSTIAPTAHALGHQPHLRRELGRLFPPQRRQCRPHREGSR